MCRQIKNTFLFLKNRFWLLTAWILGAAVFSVVFVALIVKVFCANDPEITYVHLASLLTYVVFWVVAVLLGIVEFRKTFDMMLGLGRTRKEFFISYTVVSFVKYVMCAVLIVLVALAENEIGKLLYQGIPCEWDMTSFIVSVRTMCPTVLGGLGIHLLAGALYLKFREKLLIVFWIFCCFLGVFLQWLGKLAHQWEEIGKIGDGILAFFTGPCYVLFPVVIAVAGMFCILSYFLVRKREVISW